MRVFNIAGPCDPARHYLIQPERRLPECAKLVDKQACFVVHAPRQTGKTTLMKALAQRLTAEGRYAALCFTCEEARVFTDDIAAAEHVVWSSIRDAARATLPEALRPRPAVKRPPGTYLRKQLSRWAEACPRPLVLIFDEIDSLAGEPARRARAPRARAYFGR